MTKHIKQISRTIKTLASSDKLVFFGGLIVIAGLFLPWFSINLSDLYTEDTQSTIAFTGVTYIIGYLCYLFTIAAINTIDKKLTIVVASATFCLFLLNVLLSNNDNGLTLFAAFIFLALNIATIVAIDNVKIIKRLKKHVINLFTGVQNFILIFVASMIYHRMALEYTSANTNFGVYLSLIGAGLIFYGGFLQLKSNNKNVVKEAFGSTGDSLHGGINLSPDLNIDKGEENKNNDEAEKQNSQLSFGDYE